MYNNPLARRVFLRRLAELAASAAGATAMLTILESAYADSVARDDARLESGYLEYGGLRCYVAWPNRTAGKKPVVLVIHGSGGLNAHLEHVVRRAGLAGFAAVAPDLLFPSGGTPKDEARAREMVAALDREQTIANLLAIIDDLAARPESGKIGCIGFGWGGGMANQLAVHSPLVAAASPFYGAVPDAIDVPRIKARLLLHYAERDERINTGVPAFEAALKAAGVPHAIHVYPGTDSDFHDLAWTRTMTFLTDALR